MSERPTGSYSRDPRVDRGISWALATFAGLSMCVAGYLFKDLSAAVGDLRGAVSDLKTEVAVLRVDRESIDRLDDEVKELRARVRVLEAK